MAEYGLYAGLSRSGQWDQQIQGLRYNQEADRRAANDAEQRAKLFADDADFTNSANPYDNPLGKAYALDKLKELGRYYKDNPDARYNPLKQVEIKRLRTEVKDNPIIRRGMAVDAAYKEYLKDRQESVKNPEQWDTELLDKEGQKFNNYFKYGHEDGLQGYDRDGGAKAVVYNRPRNFVNLDEVGLKTGNSLKDFNVVKGSNLGEYWTTPKEDQVKSLTDSFYQENQRQLDKEAGRRGYANGYELGKQLVASGFNKHYSIGDPNALWERGMRERELKAKNQKPEGPSYTPFDNFVDPRIPAGNVPVDISRKIYGDKPKIELLGNNGAKADLTGFNFDYDGRYVKRNGIPFLLGSLDIPIDVAKQKGIIGDNNGVVKGDLKNAGFDASGLRGSDRISSDFLGRAVIIPNKNAKGDEDPFVRVSYQLPVNPNDQTARQMYNVHADVDKLVPASHDPFTQQSSGKKSAPQGAGVDAEGNVFDASGKYIGKRDEFQ